MTSPLRRSAAKGALIILKWGVALAPALVYLRIGFEWAVMVGFFITIAFAFEILDKQVEHWVVRGG